MRDKERGVSFYDLYIESRVRGQAEPHPVPVQVPAALRVAYATWDGQPFSLGASAIKVTLADWRLVPARRDHYLIINRADASLPDIPLRHFDNGHTRMAGKDLREGIDLTCHVLIRERVNPNRPALMLMTNGSSLTADKVAKLLGTLFRRSHTVAAHAAHFHRDHPSGEEGKKVRLLSNFTVAGHQNARLGDLLQGGQLEGVELISDGEEQLDAAPQLDVTSVSYTLQPSGAGRVGLAAIMRAIAAIRQRGNDPTKARVRYRPPGRDKVEMHTFEVAALESEFVRRERIRFADPIAPRYERVDMRVMNEMIALADRERLG